jgi:hypothetical protein
MRKTIAALVTVGLSACGTGAETAGWGEQGWRGKDEAALRQAMGQPSEVVELGAGARQLVYVRMGVVYKPGVVPFGQVVLPGGGTFLVTPSGGIAPRADVSDCRTAFTVAGGVVTGVERRPC